MLDLQLQQEDIWKDSVKVTALNRKNKSLKDTLQNFKKLKEDADYLGEIMSLQDESFAAEVHSYYKKIKDAYAALELETLLNGTYDQNDVLFTINAGVGGTDAQDWAQLLLRMYIRWIEKKGFKYEILDISEGEEAGLKSVTLAVYGDYAYGLLRAEHGIHRLVRLSPFNANNKRQTSFASVDIIPEIEESKEVIIKPEDIRIDTYRSSGAGGQHVNKTDSAVRITHLPTNIVVQCQNQRSQAQNKEVAMKMLLSKLVRLNEQEQKDKLGSVAEANREISWGNQIRSYVFHPYNLVKDHRNGYETGNVQAVMDGELDGFIEAYLHFKQESLT